MSAHLLGCAGDELVEREEELERLGTFLERLEQADGRVARLEAPAGHGKTALLRATVARARRQGIAVGVATGSEMEAESPFGVVRQLLEPWVLARPVLEQPALFDGAAGLARPVFDPSADATTTAGGEHGVLHGLFWLTARMASPGPLLLAVDDIALADGASLRFLGFLARRCAGLPLLVLLAGRPERIASGAAALDATLQAVGAARIGLPALSRAGVALLLERRTGTAPSAAFTAACHEVTRGNPFYVERAIDDLVDRGVRPDDENTEAVRRLVPRAVGRAVATQATHLAPGARALVEAVAILGDGTERSVAARLADISPEAADDAAEVLAGEAVLEPGERLAFVHPIARSAVYAGLTPTDRSARHAAAVGLLRAVGASPERVIAQLLRTAPGAVSGTADALEGAATEALARGAPETAVRCLERMLLEELEVSRRSAVRLKLAGAAVRAGLPEAEPLLQGALAGAVTTVQRTEAATALSRLLLLSGRRRAAADVLITLADELAVSGGDGCGLELELLALAHIDLALRPEVGDRLAQAARRTRRWAAADDPLVLADRAITRLRRGVGAPRAGALALAALDSSHASPSPVADSLLRPLLLYVLVAAEHYEQADRHCEVMAEVGRDEGSARLSFDVAASRSLIHLRTGRLDASEAEARQALELATLNDWPPLRLVALIGLIDAVLLRTGPEAAGALLEQVAADLDRLDTSQAAAVLFLRGKVRVAAGDLEGGCGDLLECGRRFDAWGMANPAVCSWRAEAALALTALGDRRQAQRLAQEAIVLAGRWGTPRPLGMALRAGGVLEEGAASLATLTTAVAVLESSAARPELSCALIELGAAQRRAGQRSAARGPLRRGVELAQACGAQGLARQGRAELRIAGGRTRSPAQTGLDALTPSEARIAAMAARGRSNPEIAQELFLTPKTIEMHLTGAYRKLGISSRRQLPAILGPAAATEA